MPALVGANFQDAQDMLQALGSYVLTQTDASGMERFQVLDSAWKVCGQRPRAGAEVSVDKMVELLVVKLHEGCRVRSAERRATQKTNEPFMQPARRHTFLGRTHMPSMVDVAHNARKVAP